MAITIKQIQVLNGRFDALTLPQTVEAIFQLLQAGRRGWLCTVNVAILMMMRSDARLQNFVDQAELSVADGQPIVWFSPFFGKRLPERVTGIDLIEAICRRASINGKKIYLLGATDDVASGAVQQLRSRHPGLNVEWANGYFSNTEACARADQIRASGADILFVAMGVPRQEHFIEDQWERLGVGMAIGVGGSLDVLSGLRRRAPAWVQQVGMEWLFRLVQEPRRLLVRYATTNSQFLWLAVRALLRKKFGFQ
jgi:N-acetylglucosaminyldiphosphoundecaprenol N-acetyl-beta-D-mannosaminyltransferase